MAAARLCPIPTPITGTRISKAISGMCIGRIARARCPPSSKKATARSTIATSVSFRNSANDLAHDGRERRGREVFHPPTLEFRPRFDTSFIDFDLEFEMGETVAHNVD